MRIKVIFAVFALSGIVACSFRSGDATGPQADAFSGQEPRAIPPFEECTYPQGIVNQLRPWRAAVTTIAAAYVHSKSVDRGTIFRATLRRVYLGRGTSGEEIRIAEPDDSLVLESGREYLLVLAEDGVQGNLTAVQAGYGIFEIDNGELVAECTPGAEARIRMSPGATGGGSERPARVDLGSEGFAAFASR
jgi:hypothetical protein